jgi:uncharacterized membrane protein
VIQTTVQRDVQSVAAIAADTAIAEHAARFCESAARGPSNSLSGRQRDVLRALVNAVGTLPVRELVRRHLGPLAVARASTSRTLHRLHARGLIALLDKHGRPGAVHYARRACVTAAGARAVTSPERVSTKRSAEAQHGA